MAKPRTKYDAAFTRQTVVLAVASAPACITMPTPCIASATARITMPTPDISTPTPCIATATRCVTNATPDIAIPTPGIVCTGSDIADSESQNLEQNTTHPLLREPARGTSPLSFIVSDRQHPGLSHRTSGNRHGAFCRRDGTL